jgi:hypothetical protein
LSVASNTGLIVLARHEDAAEFDGECLLIPAADVPAIAVDDGPHLGFDFRPSSRHRTRLDPYRRRTKELDRLVLEACGKGAEVRRTS